MIPRISSAVAPGWAASGWAAPAEVIAAVLGLARDLCGCGAALVARIDGDAWRVAHVDDVDFGLVPGLALPLRELPCSLVRPDGPLLLDDALNDEPEPRFPGLVGLGVRAYAGVAVVLPDDTVYGTLAALDPRPGALPAKTLTTLPILARLVAHELEHALPSAKGDEESADAPPARNGRAHIPLARSSDAVAGEAIPLPGDLGDARAVELLAELAALTRLIPDLPDYLARACSLVRRRLGYEDVLLLLADPARGELVVAAHDGKEAGVAAGDRLPLDRGDYGSVLRTGALRNAVDLGRESGWDAPPDGTRRAELVVPLLVGGGAVGLVVGDARRVAAFTAADEAVLTAVADLVAAAVHVARVHDAAQRAAATDGLTGLLNHRAFYEALGRQLEAAAPLSVVLLDVEGLKTVNDTVGHLAGDELLRRVARVVRQHVRADDAVARYGGDEFALVLQGRDRATATRIAARIRRALLATSGVAREPRTTVRYGVATAPADGTLPGQLVAAADRRLLGMRDRRGPDPHPTPAGLRRRAMPRR